jgi:hypothetical protein
MTDEILFLFVQYHEAIRAQREVEQKTQFREAMIARDAAAEMLKSALGDGYHPVIDAMVYRNETPAALAASLTRIAAYIDARIADPLDEARLAASILDVSAAAALRAHAAIIAPPEAAPPEIAKVAPKKRGLLRLLGFSPG